MVKVVRKYTLQPPARRQEGRRIYFCKAQVEAKQIVSMHWKQKHWFSCRKMYIFSERRGYVGGRGNAKYWFSCRKMKVFSRGEKMARIGGPPDRGGVIINKE